MFQCFDTKQDIPVANVADVDAAVAAASAAYKGPWSKFSAGQRAACLNKLADLIDAKKNEIGQLETACMGMPSAIATHMVPGLGAKLMRYYAGWADKFAGESFPPDGEGDGLYKIVQYEPLGVCAAIAAWNATPLDLGLKLAPALATGNTVIFKASEKSPLGMNVAASCVAEAGFPPGVINFVSGGGSTGALLAEHMAISKIGFTGSGSTGRKVQEAAVKSNMKRVTLELGGKSPAVVFADAVGVPQALDPQYDKQSRHFDSMDNVRSLTNCRIFPMPLSIQSTGSSCSPVRSALPRRDSLSMRQSPRSSSRRPKNASSRLVSHGEHHPTLPT